ncbi:hypothetical protein [uncultured Flavobacterium sp.]|uniref:hypothetical protein n=1 Tax=uncultured Flavobacterium sp. TaxID=165435 RepID=UPI0030CA46A4|tara:strand:- start:466 stop:984 length:519 start_codon:yes stop_codon:yes gene_type:complete
MKIIIFKIILALFMLSLFQRSFSQAVTQKNNWKKVQYGGGLGLGFNNGSTTISVLPSSIYNFNKKIALGLGMQYSYINQKNTYTSHLYGGSVIGLFNPINEIQLSAELEKLRVHVEREGLNSNSQDYWNTALFMGAGYRVNNATIGIRYNILYKENNNIYTAAFIPFVRVYF